MVNSKRGNNGNSNRNNNNSNSNGKKASLPQKRQNSAKGGRNNNNNNNSNNNKTHNNNNNNKNNNFNKNDKPKFTKRKPATEEELEKEMDDYFMKSKNPEIAGKKLDDDMDAYWAAKGEAKKEADIKVDEAAEEVSAE
ncbi:hypothetical protein ScalyP_jg8168 [Parmales sp. scaly parma]|nr:hypothetical protein ScalyP_jg8168 [Parmales sp. scaly parma]